jgi:hypothetical protein
MMLAKDLRLSLGNRILKTVGACSVRRMVAGSLRYSLVEFVKSGRMSSWVIADVKSSGAITRMQWMAISMSAERRATWQSKGELTVNWLLVLNKHSLSGQGVAIMLGSSRSSGMGVPM